MKPTWMVVIGLIAAVSSCPDCCTVHVVLEASTEQSPVDPCSCNITIDDLSRMNWYLDNNSTMSNGPQREFLFQSGIHHSYNSSSLIFESVQSVVIGGVPTATIRCQNVTFCVMFESVEVILIRDVHIVNCRCSQHDRWQWDKSLRECELHHIPISADIKIMNSKFTNSRLLLQHKKTCKDCYINLDAIILIKNTIIENCCDSTDDNPFLCAYMRGFHYIFKLLLNFTLESLIIRNNYFPFLVVDDTSLNTSAVSITLTGHSNITYYKGKAVIYTENVDDVQTSLVISTAVVYVTNNIHTVGEDEVDFAAPIVAVGDTVLVFEHCHVVFSDNYGQDSGGIVMRGTMVFNDDVLVEFSNNIGESGGALNMGYSSMIFNATESSIELVFINNSARIGGAINFGDGDDYTVTPNFVLQCSTALVSLNFFNNSALLGGNQVYGGWVDWFKGEDDLIRYKPDTMKEILNFESDDDSDSDVASCPIRICLCVNGHPDCNITYIVVEVYGYAINLGLIAIGERFTPVPAYYVETWKMGETIFPNLTGPIPGGVIEWIVPGPNHQTDSLQTVCTNIVHVSHSKKEALTFIPTFENCDDFRLYSEPDYNISDSMTAQAIMVIFQQLSVVINYNDCPLGFIISEMNDRICVCKHFILSLGLSCDIEAVKIRRNKHQWVSIAHEHNITSSENPGVIVYPYCPFDYCRTDNESLLIRLEDQFFKLCAFNRSGILCGSCETNYSRVLGSSRCEVCSLNFQMFAIILGWLLFGLMLVIILMLLDLTVSVGTINGLTFYANIIQAQRTTFFTPDISNSFLCKFIAWLNLDQGFETCLYNGLDEYTITWLQFLFPLYIWLLATALIVTSHCSTRISKLMGNNAVQVLATLFLITYAKLLQLIIRVFSFTVIDYPDGFKKMVWLVDGNVEFFKGRHIPLVLVTIIFVLLYLSYTIVLLTIQFLYKISPYCTVFRVKKLKPLFDAYTVPYRDNHRYWTGLLFIARIVLLAIFSLNYRKDISLNLFVITLVSFGLVGWLGICRWVYEHPLNNLLEVAFLFNLGITSAAVFFDKGNTVAIKVSTIFALTVFIALILFHVLRRLLLTSFGLELKKRLLSYKITSKDEEEVTGGYISIGQPTSSGKRSSEVTFSTVSIGSDLNEPLLEPEQ